jgi:hypothetical protein
MTQLEYYRQEPNDYLPHRGGLRAWGITMIVLGALSAVVACFAAVFWFVFAMRFMPATTMPRGQMTSAMLTGILVYVFAAIILIWLGRGSQLGRRWIRPVMVSGTIVMAFSGLAALVPLILSFAALAKTPIPLSTATTGPTTTTTTVSGSTVTVTSTFTYNSAPNFTLIGIVSGSCMLLVMEALPLTLLWFYGRPSVQATLDQLDPNPRWTDRCPQAVLTWCFVCLFQGWGLLTASLRAVVPFFSTILVGPAAVVALLLIAGLLVGGGYLCYRMNRIGWVLSVLACVVMFTSYLTFAVLGDQQRYLNLILATLQPTARGLADQMSAKYWASPMLMYLVQLIYAVWILKFFSATTSAPKSTKST